MKIMTVAHTVKSKGEISQKFVAFSEYMNFTTLILGKTMDENNGNGKTEFQFESEEHCFNTCNITQPEWCRNIEVGLS